MQFFERSLVRILAKQSRSVIGAGCLLTKEYILTCAHVVNIATDGALQNIETPLEVEVQFPFISTTDTYKARVVGRSSLSDEDGDDLALLELTDDLPSERSPAPLIFTSDWNLVGFKAYGFPEGYPNGIWASGLLRGKVARGRVQIEDIRQTGYFIEPGFSGTAVWNDKLDGVFGIVVSADIDRTTRVAFMIPSERVQNIVSTMLSSSQAVFSPLVSKTDLASSRLHFLPRLPDQIIERYQVLRRMQSLAVQGKPIALYGRPGSGKTTLVKLFIKEYYALFPDGIFWARLGPNATEEDVYSELGGWAVALGITESELSVLNTVNRRAQAITKIIGNKRILLVADDVWNDSIAKAFRLGGHNCVSIITTRISLVADLFAGTEAVNVEEFSADQAVQLLKRLAGDWITEYHDIAHQLVARVGYSPLGVFLLGKKLQGKARGNRSRRLQELLVQLHSAEEILSLSEHQPADEQPQFLENGTPLSLQVAIAISVEPLELSTKSLLKSIALLPAKPNTFAEAAATFFADSPARVIDSLIDKGLLESDQVGRYALHQTIRDYSNIFLHIEGFDEILVKRKIVGFYTDFAKSNSTRLETEIQKIDLDWQNISFSLDTAFENSWSTEFNTCLHSVYEFLELRGHYEVAQKYLSWGLEITSSVSDKVVLLRSLISLGRVFEHIGNYEDANRFYREALNFAEVVGDQESKAYLLQNLGVVASRRGDQKEAEHYLSAALAFARQIDHRLRIGAALKNLGAQTVRTGEFDRAKDYLDEAYEYMKDLPDKSRVAGVLMNQAFLHIHKGDYESARRCIDEGQPMLEQIGHFSFLSLIMTYSGLLNLKIGNFDRAFEDFESAMQIVNMTYERQRLGLLLSYEGYLHTILTNYVPAEQKLNQSLSLAREIDNGENLCTCLIFLAFLNRKIKKLGQATTYLEEAEKVADQIGYRRLLATLQYERGELYIDQNQPQRAISEFLQALDSAEIMEYRELFALSLYGLARARTLLNKKTEAYNNAAESLKIFEDIGHYYRFEVQNWLNTIE